MINNNSLSFLNTKNLPASISVPGLARPDCVSLTEERQGEKTGMTKVWVELENKFLFDENCQVRMLSRSFNIINVPSPGVCRSYFTLSMPPSLPPSLPGIQHTHSQTVPTVLKTHNLQVVRVEGLEMLSWWWLHTTHCQHYSFLPSELPEILPLHWYLLTFIWDLHQIISGAN